MEAFAALNGIVVDEPRMQRRRGCKIAVNANADVCDQRLLRGEAQAFMKRFPRNLS